jgi:hypothetical protein
MQDGTWRDRSGRFSAGAEGWQMIAIDNPDSAASPTASTTGIYRK